MNTHSAVLDDLTAQTLPKLPEYMQAEIREIEAKSQRLYERAMQTRSWSDSNKRVGDRQAQRRYVAELDAKGRLLMGEPEPLVIRFLYQRYCEIARLSQCGCGLLLIGEEDCPRCAMEPPDHIDAPEGED